MSWTRLKYQPGIVRDATRYSAAGTWYDASLVRFRNGYPEMWGGWMIDEPTGFSMQGICRSLHRFSTLSGYQYLGVGTSKRFYVLSDDLYYDVTPLGRTASLTDPFTTTSGSAVVNVTDASHGILPGATVIISGATDTGGILAANLNGEHLVTGYIDENTYQITAATSATSTATGGGAVTINYLLNIGSDNVAVGGGWGSDAWSVGPWGDPTAADKLGMWTQGNWGEDLVANVNKGGIYYWDASSPSNRMVELKDLAGADGNAPDYAEFILISHRDRHLLAFGASEFGTGNVAPMSFRWCSQENILNWNEADLNGTAGSLPLSIGSHIIAAIQTQAEIVVWTDASIYSVRYIGAPYIYGADIITDFSDIVGLKAATSFDNNVFWMGRSGFYSYTGRVQKMPCSVWDYVSSRIDFVNAEKVFASSIRAHDEIIWFYPSKDGGGEIDSYVTYDIIQNIWNIGSLSRTAWLDLDSMNNPIATGVDLHMYTHEFGSDDGSQNPSVPLNAYIESGPIELSSEGSFDKGDRIMFIRRIMPDVTFRDFGSGTPGVNFVLKMTDKPGDDFHQTSSRQVYRSVILPVEQFTDQLHVRVRGRSMTFRIENCKLGSKWRVGTPRIDVRTDGQR